MNDISGAIISYHYYRDGYYVSRGALGPPPGPPFSFCTLSRTLIHSLARSPRHSATSPSRFLASNTLSFHLPPPLSGNTLLPALHARNQVTALQESKSGAASRGLVLSNICTRARRCIPISSGKGRWLRRRFDRTFAYQVRPEHC